MIPLQLWCDGKIVGTLQVIDGIAKYACVDFANSEHEFVAKYSGTTSIAPSVSQPVKIAFADEASIPAQINDANLTLKIKGNVLEITANKPQSICVYNINGMLHSQISLAPGINSIQLPAGMYIVNGQKIAITI